MRHHILIVTVDAEILLRKPLSWTAPNDGLWHRSHKALVSYLTFSTSCCLKTGACGLFDAMMSIIHPV